MKADAFHGLASPRTGFPAVPADSAAQHIYMEARRRKDAFTGPCPLKGCLPRQETCAAAVLSVKPGVPWRSLPRGSRESWCSLLEAGTGYY